MRGYFDTIARALHGGERRQRPVRIPRIRGRRSTFIPVREDDPRIAAF